jgi:hypothetical protein
MHRPQPHQIVGLIVPRLMPQRPVAKPFKESVSPKGSVENALTGQTSMHRVHGPHRLSSGFSAVGGKARLIDSDESLKSLAGDLGFYNVSHFDRVFRRQTGMTAGAYRDQNRLR